MVWVVLILVLLAVGGFFVLLAKFVMSHVREAEKHRTSEEFFAKFSYTKEEWDHFYQSEFIDDDRVKGFFGEYSDVISVGQYEPGDAEKQIHFSDRSIYLTGDGKRKSFVVNRLNLIGNGIHLTSIRLLRLAPLKKLQVKVRVDIDLDDYRVNRDLDYLIPLPDSAMAEIDEILRRYDAVT